MWFPQSAGAWDPSERSLPTTLPQPLTFFHSAIQEAIEATKHFSFFSAGVLWSQTVNHKCTINNLCTYIHNIPCLFPVIRTCQADWNTYTWPIYSSSGHRSIFCGVSVVCGRDAVNPALSKGQGQLWVMEYDWRMKWSATPKIFHHPQWELKKIALGLCGAPLFLTGSRTTALMVAWSWSHMISTCEQWMLLIEPGTCVSPLFPKL